MLGPKLLGNATNIIFEGFVGTQLPAGLTQDQAVAALDAAGQTDQADMVASMTLTPGQGVDFTALARILALVVVVYVLSSVLSWAQNYLMAGVTQRTIYRLREEVDTKLGRLPLRYFDSSSRGDVLSRVTNDIDNISNDAAADAHAAHHRRPDGHRRAGDDVLDQPAAGGHLAADGAAVLLSSRCSSPSGPSRTSSRSGSGPARSTATSRRPSPATTS